MGFVESALTTLVIAIVLGILIYIVAFSNYTAGIIMTSLNVTPSKMVVSLPTSLIGTTMNTVFIIISAGLIVFLIIELIRTIRPG
jgi:hypothetical protein